MVKLNRKIIGYTLIETIISMIIVLLIFSITMMIFIKLEKTNRLTLHTEIFFKMKEILEESKYKHDFIDNIYVYENFEIRKTINNYLESNSIKIISIKAFDNQNRFISEVNELVIDY
jgi:hypothetical protein